MITLQSSESNQRAETPRRGIGLIKQALESLDFGVVLIKIHNREVVQIEVTRKIRIPSSSPQVQDTPTVLTEAKPPK